MLPDCNVSEIACSLFFEKNFCAPVENYCSLNLNFNSVAVYQAALVKLSKIVRCGIFHKYQKIRKLGILCEGDRSTPPLKNYRCF